LLLGVKAAENAVGVSRKLELGLNDKSGIRVIEKIVFRDAIVFDRVVDQPTKKCDVGTRANLAKKIRDRCGAREPRVDDNHFCVPRAYRFDGPLETARMVLCRVPAHDQHHVGVLDIDPAVGHCPASERWSQT
jgi:hypothetical protein